MAVSGATIVAPMREEAAIPPAFSAAFSAARSRTRNCTAASRAPWEISGGSVPKWLRKAAGSITLMSPRGVDTVIPLDVAERSRMPVKADKKM